MPTKQEVKQQYRELINQGKHKTRRLNYRVAVSSGLRVSQEIPAEAYKRVAWASNQGANFVELYTGGTPQIYNEWNNLLSMAEQLGISMDCHTPANLPLDLATPYREQAQQLGFYYAHEFLYKFIEAWGEFQHELQKRNGPTGEPLQGYGINSHLVKSQIPPRSERMARSISVDPFGEDIMESRIFAVPEFRVGFFNNYLWPEQLRDNFDTLRNIASDIEGFTDFNIIFRRQIIDYMSSNGYLSDRLLKAISNIGDKDTTKENLEYLLQNRPGVIDEQDVQRPLEQFVSSQYPTDPETVAQTPRYRERIQQADNPQAEIQNIVQENQEKRRQLLEGNPVNTIQNKLDDDEREQIKNLIVEQMTQQAIYVDRAINNIAGTQTDVPEEIKNLEDHREGSSIAQNIPRFDPNLHTNSRWAILIPKIFWELDDNQCLREPEEFQEKMDTIVENVKGKLKEAIVDRLKKEEIYQLKGERDYLKEDEVGRKMSVGEVAFRDIINFRGGAYRDNMSRPSVIFWYIMPWWMPFSGNKHLKNIWRDITEIEPDNYSLAKGNLDDYQKELEKLKDHERYERVVAAGAGAYVWGHMTQFIGPGQEKTLVELLDEYGLTMDWEAHTTGPEGKGKLWKPRDIIKVCKAINDTEVNGVKHDVMRATIDMEHLAVNGVNPLWVIEGNEEKGFKGLDPGDARFISKQHVTHPALSEQQHEHQPIRRGDTIVYRHLESLVERGFCQREDRPCIILYELGGEKAESTFMLRLMMHMLELGITSEELESGVVDKAMEKFDQGSEDLTLREYTILKFFGLTDEEWHHEWQKIFEHALDPLSGLLEIASPEKTWSGSRPIQEGTRPEEWEEEKYQ